MDPAFVLTLEVESVLFGEAPRQIDVLVGFYSRTTWRPYPAPCDGVSFDDVCWLDQGDGEELRTGQMIGVPLRHYSEYGIWSLMAEPLFVFSDGARGDGLRFQSSDGLRACPVTRGPANMGGETLEELRAVLGACSAESSAIAEQRRSDREGRYPDGVDSGAYFPEFAGRCLVTGQGGPAPAPPCTPACGDGYVCIDLDCVAVDAPPE